MYKANEENETNLSAGEKRKVFLKLPLEMVCYLMQFLDYVENFQLVLCYVYANYIGVKPSEKQTTFAPNYFKGLFYTANKLNKTLSAPGFFYVKGKGCFAWGDNYFGDLGLGYSNNMDIPHLIPTFYNKELLAIAKAPRHSLFLTNTHELYACGINLYHLGLGNQSTCVIPTLVRALKGLKLKAIAAGVSHSLVLSEEYKVYSSGQPPASGQPRNYSSPQLIQSLADKKIVGISAGWDHSLFLSEAKEVYACGANNFGELGFKNKDRTSHYYSSPILIEVFTGKIIIAIATGKNYSLALTDKHEVFAFGKNPATGLPPQHYPILPQQIPAFKNIKIYAFSAGTNHALYLTENYEVYSSGLNNFGQLGIGNKEDQNSPQLIASLNGLKIVAIHAGEYFSQFVTDTNEVYVCGKNSEGELGLGHNQEINTPTRLVFRNQKLIKFIERFDTTVNLKL